MKPRLIEHLRCVACRAPLRLRQSNVETAESAAGLEVMEGMLECTRCSAAYAVSAGVPRMREDASPDDTRPRTAASFGHLWGRSTPGTEVYDVTSYHFAKMERSLSLEPPKGLVLDAGCGDGIDLANQASRDGVEAVGVELSDGGCATSYLRARDLAHVHVVQADLCRLPFADNTFDFIYSYGVLHHLGYPENGLTEVVRVARPGAQVAAYLYEDFSERPALLRWALKAANTARTLTTQMPNRLLYNLCRIASPFVFAAFTVPSLLGKRVPMLAQLAEGLPFRHGTGPFSLVGDLYDRFSAPVEFRYSRRSSARFFSAAGLERIKVAFERGWMVIGTKPAIKERAGREDANG
jgi:SAM-dependent methyltransferase